MPVTQHSAPSTQHYLAAVVVLTWNGRRYLAPCLEALRRQTLPGLRVIVVDNGSTDGTVDYVCAQFPEVEVVALAQNIGFAAGNNAGIRAAGDARYVLTLNNDTQAQPRWAEALVAAAEADPRGHRRVVDGLRRPAGVVVAASPRLGRRHRNAWATRPARMTPCSLGACAGAALYRTRCSTRSGWTSATSSTAAPTCFRAQLAGWPACSRRGVVWRPLGDDDLRSPRKLFLLQRNRGGRWSGLAAGPAGARAAANHLARWLRWASRCS
jgi:hypothetical protein